MDFKYLWLRVNFFLFIKTLWIRRKFEPKYSNALNREYFNRERAITDYLAKGIKAKLDAISKAENKPREFVFKSQLLGIDYGELDGFLDLMHDKYGEKITKDQIEEMYNYFYDHKDIFPNDYAIHVLAKEPWVDLRVKGTINYLNKLKELHS